MHFVRIANFLVVYFTSVFLNVRSSNVFIHATFSVIKETKIFSKDMAQTAKNSASSLPRMKGFHFSRNCIHVVEVFPELRSSKTQFDFQGLLRFNFLLCVTPDYVPRLNTQSLRIIQNQIWLPEISLHRYGHSESTVT